MPNLELAREIVAALVHLKEPETAVPIQGREAHAAIHADYQAYHLGSSGDPLLAAEAWLLAKLSGHPEQADAPPQTGGKAELGVPLADRPLGDLTDAELESLTAPEKEGA